MENLVSKKKMPIIVGGTNYYIESLIWQTLVDDPKQEDAATVDSDEELICNKIRRIEGVSNEELHKKLMEVDPEMATRLHPNNRRKIIRFVSLYASSSPFPRSPDFFYRPRYKNKQNLFKLRPRNRDGVAGIYRSIVTRAKEEISISTLALIKVMSSIMHLLCRCDSFFVLYHERGAA